MKHFLLFMAITLSSYSTLLSQEFEYITPAQDGLMPGIMYEIIFDSSENAWTCTWINGSEGPGIATFNGTEWSSITQAEGASSDHVISILEDSDGNLWFGTTFADGNDIALGKFDGTDWTYFNILEDTALNVNDIIEDTEGILWFATSEGAFAYDGTTFTQYTTTDGLVSNSLTGVIQDDEGNLWFGSSDSGASRFDGTTWTTFTNDDGLASVEIQALYKDGNGTIWFGSGFTDTGVTSYDGTNFTIYTVADGLASNNVRYINGDSEGNLWFAGTGVTRFDGTDWFILDSSNGLLDNLARSVQEAPNGDIWIGSFDGISVLKAGSLSAASSTLSSFKVYPNPVKDVLQIDNKQEVTSISKIEVHNLIGQVVHTQKQQRSIDMSSLSKGMYLVTITGDNGNSETVKVLKE